MISAVGFLIVLWVPVWFPNGHCRSKSTKNIAIANRSDFLSQTSLRQPNRKGKLFCPKNLKQRPSRLHSSIASDACLFGVRRLLGPSNRWDCPALRHYNCREIASPGALSCKLSGKIMQEERTTLCRKSGLWQVQCQAKPTPKHVGTLTSQGHLKAEKERKGEREGKRGIKGEGLSRPDQKQGDGDKGRLNKRRPYAPSVALDSILLTASNLFADSPSRYK